MENAWILKYKGKESAFGGNEGYADQPDSHYVYDTTVKNHDKIARGDLVVIAGKKYIVGFARIENILVESGVRKRRFRCPVCNTQEHYLRRNKTPRYKCRNKHEFDSLVEEVIEVDQYVAFYASTFIPAPTKLLTKILDEYYVRRNAYYSIQLAKAELLQQRFHEVVQKLFAEDGDLESKWRPKIRLPTSQYIPSGIDTRIFKTVRLAPRLGQHLFREVLFKIYGIRCMLSGCGVREAIEASHIIPYRGKDDNHPQNGLLLRSDLHALFAANLLAIDPETLRVSVHPSLMRTEYWRFEGCNLKIMRTDFGPSKEALQARWRDCGGQFSFPKNFTG